MIIDVKNQLNDLPQLGKWRLTGAEAITLAGTDGRCYFAPKDSIPATNWSNKSHLKYIETL